MWDCVLVSVLKITTQNWTCDTSTCDGSLQEHKISQWKGM
jgi:hypothetical protein